MAATESGQGWVPGWFLGEVPWMVMVSAPWEVWAPGLGQAPGRAVERVPWQGTVPETKRLPGTVHGPGTGAVQVAVTPGEPLGSVERMCGRSQT